MEKKQFYKKIDELTEHWYIDANKPVKGTFATTKHPKGQGPRRKTNAKGEENPINNSSGEVQIIRWAHCEQFCQNCCKMVENKIEEINLEKKIIKCSCGLKYPICLDKSLVNSK
jgi:hypothetical protein